MRISEAVGKGFGVVIGVVASCGLSQLYGLIKGTVELIKIAHASYQIKKIDNEMAKIRNLPGSQEEMTLSQALRGKIVAYREVHEDGLKHAGKALVPLVGAIWATSHKGYGLGPAASFASTAEDILIESKPDGLTKILFPGAKVPDYIGNWLALGADMHHITVKMEGNKTRTIEALWVPGKDCKPEGRTVILYHGNGMTLYDMNKHAEKYKEAGFNVLVTTLGGEQYGQRNPEGSNNASVSTSELTMYADVDGEMEFLNKMGVKEVGVHGLSIGGTKAFQAGSKYGNKEGYPHVKFIVAEQTLTSASAVVANAANNIAWAGNFGHALGRTAAPIGKVDTANGNRSDGLNSEAKAKKLHSDVQVLAIASKKDALMGRNKNRKDGTYENNFAEELMRARYPNEPDKQALWINGGHCVPIDDNTFDQIVDFANKSCPKE